MFEIAFCRQLSLSLSEVAYTWSRARDMHVAQALARPNYQEELLTAPNIVETTGIEFLICV